ncbi:DUF4403 family protein [Peijinzhouia sedimentorum]
MLKSKISFLLLVLIIAVYVSSCNKIEPEGPSQTLLDSSLVVPVSTITIPVSYEVRNLEDLVNKKLEGVFFKKWLKLNSGGDSLFLELERTSRVQLSWANQALQIEFPIHVSGNFIKKFMGMSLKNQAPIEAEMVLHLTTGVEVNPDWSLNTNTKLEKIDWIKNPELKIAMVKLDIKEPIEDQLFANQETLLEELDKVLREEIKTRDEVAKIWNDIQKEIVINKEEPRIYMIAEGESLAAKFLNDDPAYLTLLVQMKAFAETKEGESPPFVEKPLPTYSDQINNDDSVQIFVLAKLPFSRANELLRKELIDKKIAFNNVALNIKDLDIYATDQGLAVRLDVKGAVNGHLYLVGEPAFDEATSTFWVDKLEYDIQTENVIVNSMDGMFHDNFLEFISEYLTFDAAPLINDLPNMIETALDKGKSGEKIDIEISHMHARPYSIVLTRNDIQVILETRASADLQLKGLKSSAKPVRVN